MMDKEIVFSGYIKNGDYGDNYDAWLLGDKPVTLLFQYNNLLNKNLTISYYISDKEKTLEEAKEGFIKSLFGISSGVYSDHYSEITGYLWTDEDLQIGGHDLLGELGCYEGKYCNLIVRFTND